MRGAGVMLVPLMGFGDLEDRFGPVDDCFAAK
jgi:hypothetical protein